MRFRRKKGLAPTANAMKGAPAAAAMSGGAETYRSKFREAPVGILVKVCESSRKQKLRRTGYVMDNM